MALVLQWARVDAAISQIVAASFSLSPTAGAILMERTSVADRLRKVRQLQLSLGRNDHAKSLQKVKKQYEEHAKPRNMIAHAACAGVWTQSRQHLVFMPFEVEGAYGNLAIEAIHINVIRRATRFGIALEKNIMALVDETGFFSGRPVDEERETPDDMSN